MSAYSGVIFGYLGIAKKKKKRDSGFCKKVACNRMGNGFINNFLQPPFGNCMGKGVICFSPVKLLPAPEKYTGGDHKMPSNG